MFWMGAEKLRLDGRKISSFGRSLKYFIWMVVKILGLDSVKILRLDARQNSSFGWSPKFVFWTDVQNLDSGILSGWASKNFFWEVQTN